MNWLRLDQILQQALELNASDVHLTVSRQPTYRVNGILITVPEEPRLTMEDTMELGREMIPNEKAQQQLDNTGQTDFSITMPRLGRVRVNIYKQRGSWAIVVKLIPLTLPDLDTSGLPSVTKELVMRPSGLLLVTGSIGNGTTTTLAAMINYINQHKSGSILTLEDPIEYLHRHNKSIVNQREIGSDCLSFAEGLEAAFRQNPDVVMLGEMKDLETISGALDLAESGHLVISTLNATNALQAIERVVDVFEPNRREKIRLQMANSLVGIISQHLIPEAKGSGRVLAYEVLINSSAIRNMLRNNALGEIEMAIKSRIVPGMISLEASLNDLYEQGFISEEEMNRKLGEVGLI